MTVNLTHQKGGTGKSTLSYNLAMAFKLLGYKVRLLDLDIQDTCVSINEQRETPLDYIINIKNEQEFIEYINDTKEDEINIVDSGGFDSNITRLAIMGADINLTPVADKVTELLAVVKKYSVILEDIANETEDEIKSYVILNNIHSFATKFSHIENIFKEQERMELLSTITKGENGLNKIPFTVRTRGIYDKSLIDGKTVQEAANLTGNKEASAEMEKLAKTLINLHLQG